jgi:hypothetical protein
MTKHTSLTMDTSFARTAAALRDLDPAQTTTLTEEERQRADATLTRILVTPTSPQHVRTVTGQPRQRRRRVLVPVALIAAAAVMLSTALSGGTAFADWTPKPTALPAPTAAAAATTCRSVHEMRDQSPRVLIGERRGGWTYVLLDGPGEEGSCLMPDDFVGASAVNARRSGGFFGHYDPNPPKAPTPARDSIIETESAAGAVSVPGRLWVGTIDGWFMYVTGYAGSDVTRVTVDPPAGPNVEASLENGRYAAWWPAGEARGDNPSMTGDWSYTVTLADGTTRRV